MNGQPPQNPWEAILIVFRWATRIPVACLLILVSACFGFLAVMFFIRLTVWIYSTYLAQPF